MGKPSKQARAVKANILSRWKQPPQPPMQQPMQQRKQPQASIPLTVEEKVRLYDELRAQRVPKTECLKALLL